MKIPFTNVRVTRAGRPVLDTDRSDRPMGDASFGRGMDLALTVLTFTAVGWLVDRWLGLFPMFTVGLLVVGSVGVFVKMKISYDVTMQRLEQERRVGGPSSASHGSAGVDDPARLEQAR